MHLVVVVVVVVSKAIILAPSHEAGVCNAWRLFQYNNYELPVPNGVICRAYMSALLSVRCPIR